MLQINAQNPGARTAGGEKKICSQIQMCGGSRSRGESPLDGTETNNSSSHGRCRRRAREGGGIRHAGHRPPSISCLIKTNGDRLQETSITSPLFPNHPHPARPHHHHHHQREFKSKVIILMCLTHFQLLLLRVKVASKSSRG